MTWPVEHVTTVAVLACLHAVAILGALAVAGLLLNVAEQLRRRHCAGCRCFVSEARERLRALKGPSLVVAALLTSGCAAKGDYELLLTRRVGVQRLETLARVKPLVPVPCPTSVRWEVWAGLVVIRASEHAADCAPDELWRGESILLRFGPGHWWVTVTITPAVGRAAFLDAAVDVR